VNWADVRFVAYQEEEHVGGARIAYFFQPLLEALEGATHAHGVRKDCRVGATVEDFCYRTERLLPGRVPNLKLEDFVFYTDQIRPEFNPDSDIMILFELILDESLEHAALADAGVADDNELEHGVVIRKRLIRDHLLVQPLYLLQVVRLVISAANVVRRRVASTWSCILLSAFNHYYIIN